MESEQGWRTAIKTAIDCGIPVPALSSALAFFDGYTSGRLPANLWHKSRPSAGHVGISARQAPPRNGMMRPLSGRQ